MSTQVCNHCHASLDAIARFCARCGSAVSQGPLDRLIIPPLTLMEKWERLSHAWTRVDVQRVLGAPLAIAFPGSDEATPASTEEWTYQYSHPNRTAPQVRGSVLFGVDDGQVQAWQAPNWSVWGD